MEQSKIIDTLETYQRACLPLWIIPPILLALSRTRFSTLDKGGDLKDDWYRICNAHNRSICKQSTVVLLRCFYVGITTWYRFVLDMITSGNFLGSHTFDSYNAMIDLFGSPPLLVNGTMLTLEHVMQKT